MNERWETIFALSEAREHVILIRLKSTTSGVNTHSIAPEGEGAIVGAYHDYIVSALGAHDEFVFARHACPSPAQT